MSKTRIESILRQQIVNYLIENPIERGNPGCYADVAKQFGVTSEQVRRIYRTLREAGLVPNDPVETSEGHKSTERQFKENVRNGEADVVIITNKRIKTLSHLLKACEVDEKEWEVISYEVNKWEVGRKDKFIDWTTEKGVALVRSKIAEKSL